MLNRTSVGLPIGVCCSYSAFIGSRATPSFYQHRAGSRFSPWWSLLAGGVTKYRTRKNEHPLCTIVHI